MRYKRTERERERIGKNERDKGNQTMNAVTVISTLLDRER